VVDLDVDADTASKPIPRPRGSPTGCDGEVGLWLLGTLDSSV